MAFMKLGVSCAVLDDEGRILLSRRGDFGSWNLPTGRLDPGEAIADAAAREAYEETGLKVEIERPVGLYYQQGWGRMNVLFLARPIGGELRQQTDETTANGFFALDELPDNLFGDFMVAHVAQGGVHQHTLETPEDVLRDLRRKLARRWVSNLLRGRPEPRWHKYDVNAGLIIQDTSGQRVMSVPIGAEQWILRTSLDGKVAPWDALSNLLAEQCNWPDLDIQWVGLVQNLELERILFVFKTTVPDSAYCSQLRWTYLGSGELLALDRAYVTQTRQNPGGVWTTVHER